MRKPAKIPIEHVRRVREILDKAPDATPEAVTTRAAIGELRAPITRLHARGYSVRKIAEMLSANGIPITYETLSTYLTLSKANHPATADGNCGGKSKEAKRGGRQGQPRDRTATDRSNRRVETQTSAKALDPPSKAESGPGASACKRTEAQGPAGAWSFPTDEDSGDM